MTLARSTRPIHRIYYLLFTVVTGVFLTHALPVAAQAQHQTATGYVYHDQNQNQTREVGEEGIAEVSVSNGREIVTTDENGRYELPVDNDDIIFVIKPKGWMTPVNHHNLPQFYYIHKPNGSPPSKYPGVAPTGPLPDEVNFPLYRREGMTSYWTLVFGDPQPYNIRQIDYLANDVVSELVDIDSVEFGMTMGDIVGDSLALFDELNSTVAQIGIPWYNVPGNHDINFDVEADTLSDETFERVYGPATYAFGYGNAHFMVIDDVIYPENGSGYVGGLRGDQIEFLDNYIDTVPENELIVLTMHIPLVEHGDSFRRSDQRKLFELLQEHPHTLSISAHTHEQEHKFFGQDAAGWTQPQPHHHFNVGTTSGSWWNGWKNENGIPHTMMRDGTPNGYAFLRIDDNEYEINWKVAGKPSSYRMNIHTPTPVVQGQENTLTVNFFNGSNRAEVEYRIDDHDHWHPMKKTAAVDPYYAALDKRWEHLNELAFTQQWQAHSTLRTLEIPGTNLPGPRNSTHLWTAELPQDIRPGRHRVEIRVTDMFGRTFRDHHLFRVEPPEEISSNG
jgi:hypothetical protein